MALSPWLARLHREASGDDRSGVGFRISAFGGQAAEADTPLSGSRIGPGYDRSWVGSGRAASLRVSNLSMIA